MALHQLGLQNWETSPLLAAQRRIVKKTTLTARISKAVNALKCKEGQLNSQVDEWMPKMEKRLIGCFSKRDRQIAIEEGMMQVALCAKNLDAELIEQIRKLLMAVEESERPRMMLQGVVRLFYADPKLGRMEVKCLRKGLECMLPQERCTFVEKEVIPGIWEDRRTEGSRGKRLRKLGVLLECIRNSDYSTRKRDVVELEDRLGGDGLAKNEMLTEIMSGNGEKNDFGSPLNEDGMDLEGRKNGKAHAKGDAELGQKGKEEGQTPSNCHGSLTT